MLNPFKFTLQAIFLGLLIGCQSLIPDSTRSDTGMLNNPDGSLGQGHRNDDEPANGAIDDLESTDETSAEETLSSAGYCRDDIYTQYLFNQYMERDKPNAGRESKAARSRNLRIREGHALHFAASRLKGLSTQYFGTLPVVMNQHVEYWIRYYKTTGRTAFLKGLIQGEALRNIIQSGLRNEGVPPELYYLAMIESGFNNRARSRAQATGTWQFMEGTAKLYGLKVGHWVDERRDPEKSTVAASRYLKELYAIFGDWYLAIAAYNAGPGKISSAIKKAGTRDYWELAKGSYISMETKDYVPKVLAAITLAANTDTDGIQFNADPADELPASTIFVNRPVMLAEIAKGIGISKDQLQRWNPELMQEIVPPASAWRRKPGYELRIPANLNDRFIEIADSLTDLDIQDVHLHVVSHGETLDKIARKYRISVGKILSMNPNLSARRLKIGKQVAIPIPSVTWKKRAIS